MRRVFLLFLIPLVMTFLIVERIGAQCHPHPIICDPIVYSDGITPVLASDITFVAYVSTRPNEQLTENSTGCAVWNGPSGGGIMVDSDQFPTFWTLGEILVIELSGAGSNYIEDESGVFTVELTVDNPQYPDGNGPNGEFILSGEGWVFETVETFDSSGRATSLAFDADGTPHISYVNNDDDNLEYAWRSSTGWEIESVDGPSIEDVETSLALTVDGTPCIAYVSDSSQKYAYRDDTGWHIETVADWTHSWTSLALDSKDHPHIAAYGGSYICDGDTTSDRYYYLQYAYNDGSGWLVEFVDSGNNAGLFCSIALDISGYPHMVHWDQYNNERHYCWKDATGWHVENLGGGSGYDFSIQIDDDGFAHMSYSTGGSIEYAHKTVSGWSVQTVATPEGGGYWTSLALDDLMLPHITYCCYGVGDLGYAFYDGSYWWIETVMDEGSVGRDNSLALDSNCLPHISYIDDSNNELVYARLIPSTNASGFLVGPQVYLTWSVVPGAAEYWVYGSTGDPFFEPDLMPPFNNRLIVLPQGALSWVSPFPTGSPGYGYTYLVFAATQSGEDMCHSNRVGEVSYHAAITEP